LHDAIRKVETQEVTDVESCTILSHLKDKLNARKEEKFIPVSVRELVSSLEEDGSYSKNQFLNVSHDFTVLLFIT
jgi:predicted nucleic acid-binding protein